MEYYVFSTQAAAQACIDYINGTPWFPIVGRVVGTGEQAPDAQKTEKWADAPQELLSGEFAVSRIPEGRLDELEVPQAARDQFLAAFGQDIRDLQSSDFVQPEPEE